MNSLLCDPSREIEIYYMVTPEMFDSNSVLFPILGVTSFPTNVLSKRQIFLVMIS